MNNAKYKETISKLLALATSPNENEAKAALLKAQELMAKHKISEAEVRGIKFKEEEKVVTVTLDHITFTGKRDPWISELTSIIAENYSCETWQSFYNGRQTRWAHFMGLESDVNVAASAFEYAVNYIRGKYDDFKVEYKGSGAKMIRAQYNSYCYGFLKGMKEAYEQQKAEQCTALVLVVPEAVQKEFKHIQNGFSRRSFYNSYGAAPSSNSYNKGRQDGRSYGSTKGLTGLKIEG